MFHSHIWAAFQKQQQQEQQQEQHQQQHARVIQPASACSVAQEHVLEQVDAVAAAYKNKLYAAAAAEAEAAEGGAGHAKPKIVALLLPRSLDYVVASLAALAAGAAFLPLDVHWPAKRLHMVLQAARPDLLVYDDSTAAAAAIATDSTQPLGGALCQVLAFGDAFRAGRKLLHHTAPQQQQQQDLPFFCVLYTSGSTGRPVGVMCTEQGFLNRCMWMQQQRHTHQADQQVQQPRAYAGGAFVPLRPGHVVAFTTATTFVDHLWELLAPLLTGADLLVVPEEEPHAAALRGPANTHRQQYQATAADVTGHVSPAALPQDPASFQPGGAAEVSSGLPAATLQQHAPGTTTDGVAAVTASAAAAAAAAEAVTQGRGAAAADSGSSLLLQPSKLLELCVEARVTHLVAVPSVLQLWLPELQRHKGRLSLKQLVSSGEGLSTTLAAQLLGALPSGCVLVNLYGSTEVSADATWQVVTPQLLQSCSRRGWVPAGLPISNMAVAVVQPAAADDAISDAKAAGAGPHAAASSPRQPSVELQQHEQEQREQQEQQPVSASAEAAGSHVSCTTHADDVDRLQTLPLGEVGEVVIAGVGVTAGYLLSGPATAPQAGRVAAVAAAAMAVAVAPGHVEQLCNSQARFQTAWLCHDNGAVLELPDAVQQLQEPQPHSTVLQRSSSPTPQAAAATQAPFVQHGLPPRQRQMRGQDQLSSLAVGRGWTAQDVVSQPRVWFRTRDLGFMTADGCLHIVGRCSHQLKVRGVRVDLLEVESALCQHRLLAELTVAAWPHPQRPQDHILVAYAVPQPTIKQQQQEQASTDHLELQRQLQQLADAALPAAARPSLYVMLEMLPRSSAGKVLRSELPQPSSTVLLKEREEELTQAAHQDLQQQKEEAAQVAARERYSEVVVMRAMVAAVPYLQHTNSQQPEVAAEVQQRASGVEGSAHTAGDISCSTGAAAAAAAAMQAKAMLEPTQDFFTAWGADSLAAATAAAALGIDVRLLFAYPTARSLSAFLRQHGPGTPRDLPEAPPPPPGGPSVLGAPAANASFTAAGRGVSAQEPHSAQQQHLQQQQPSMPVLKRPRLSSTEVFGTLGAGGEGGVASAGPLQQEAGLQPPRVAEMLSAAAAAVVVGAASRALLWKLSDRQHAGVPAHEQRQSTTAQTEAGPGATAHQQQHSSAQHVPQSKDMAMQWRVQMGRCVDAAPLLLVLLNHMPGLPCTANQQPSDGLADTVEAGPGPASGAGVRVAAAGTAAQTDRGLQAAGAEEGVGALAFACSHSGLVKCVHVPTGVPCWSTALPSRADVGLCLSRCCSLLAVPAGDGRLHCLGTADGCVRGSLDCRSEVRAPPATDPWLGLWWVVTHAKELLAVEPHSLAVVSRLSLPAAGSAAMAFACTTTAAAAAAGGHGASPQHLVLLGLLNGCLVAVSVTELITAQMQLLPSVQPVISSTQQHQQHDSMACKSQAQRAVLTVRWQAQGPAPIFSSPAVESEQGLVIAAAVDGTVTALKLSTGQQLWQVQQHGGQVFADLMLQRLPLLSGAHAGPVTATGTDVSGSAVVVMATKAGNVFCLDTATGAKVCEVSLGGSGVSAAPALAMLTLEQLLAMVDDGLAPASSTLVVCSTNGAVDTLQLQPCDASTDTGGPRLLSAVRGHRVMLPGEGFSSPVAVRPWLVVGCRDDYLYCLSTASQF